MAIGTVRVPTRMSSLEWGYLYVGQRPTTLTTGLHDTAAGGGVMLLRHGERASLARDFLPVAGLLFPVPSTSQLTSPPPIPPSCQRSMKYHPHDSVLFRTFSIEEGLLLLSNPPQGHPGVRRRLCVGCLREYLRRSKLFHFCGQRISSGYL
jgi:hypothetical protein